MRARVAKGLAFAFLGSSWTLDEMVAAGRTALDARPPWLRPLALRTRRAFPEAPVDRPELLAEWIEADSGFERAWARQNVHLRIRCWPLWSPSMGEAAEPLRGISLPRLATPGDLADWLELEVCELEWLADRRSMSEPARDQRLRHYRERWIEKRSGGYRLLESPKPRLKAIQQRIHRELLAQIPTHEAAQGFVPGRSVMTHASRHAGKLVVMRLDLADFFTTVGAGRVTALFRALGYPSETATLMAALCTRATPTTSFTALPQPQNQDEVRRRRVLIERLRARHLPQGAPSSPALSNLCCFRLDRRLAGVAKSLEAEYSRYADDLAFSGSTALERATDRGLVAFIGAIVADEGFALRFRKTVVMRSGRQQRLTGLIVNSRPNISRRELDRLEATLTNCVRFGPTSQNREGRPDFKAHLQGLVAWAEQVNHDRARKLRPLLEQIEWPGELE